MPLKQHYSKKIQKKQKNSKNVLTIIEIHINIEYVFNKENQAKNANKKN